jgi:hypothetical protein
MAGSSAVYSKTALLMCTPAAGGQRQAESEQARLVVDPPAAAIAVHSMQHHDEQLYYPAHTLHSWYLIMQAWFLP